MPVKNQRRIAALLAVGGIAAVGLAGACMFPAAQSMAAENGMDLDKMKQMARQMLKMQLGREPTQAELDQMDKMMGGAMQSTKSQRPASAAENAPKIDIPKGSRIFKASTRQTMENGSAQFDAEDSLEITFDAGSSGMESAGFADKNASPDGP